MGGQSLASEPPLLLCNLYWVVQCTTWKNLIHLSHVAQDDLCEWIAGMVTWDSHLGLTRLFDIVLDTDTSLTGWHSPEGHKHCFSGMVAQLLRAHQ
jgi:hypothetical protein